MPTTTTPSEPRLKWSRRENGRFRLHLNTGTAIEFDGWVRYKQRPDLTALEYEAGGDQLSMFPAFADLVAIEKIG